MSSNPANTASSEPGLRSWVTQIMDRRVLAMLFLGLSAGLPLLLIFSSLSLWLREAGVERATVTYFSWAALGYSFKFVWAPLIDQLRVPLLTRWLGRRRGWLLLSQLMVAVSMVLMASIDPANGASSLTWMAFAAVMLGFSSATQDIVVDAFRIESAPGDLQALLSATYVAGYRIGMLLSGAGALFAASYFGSELGTYSYVAWQQTYLLMAACMGFGVLTTLLVAEPVVPSRSAGDQSQGQAGFFLTFLLAVGAFVAAIVGLNQSGAVADWPVLLEGGARLLVGGLAAAAVCYVLSAANLLDVQMVANSYVGPLRDFFSRYPLRTAGVLLALVGLYRISDIVLGVIANVFYQDMGFDKETIATVVKSFGLFMTIAGGFAGGVLTLRWGVMRMLMVGALMTVLTNLAFVWLARSGADIWVLYAVISADNLTAGFASAVFIAFLSALTNIQFTAVQYALFSSLMTLIPKLVGGYSGSLVDWLGYEGFFVFAAVLGVPILALVWLASRLFTLDNSPK